VLPRWQALRAKDIANETEKKEESLLKLTTQEREIRKRIEDIVDHGQNSKESPSNALMESSNIKPPNGHHSMKMNGDQGKKGKKRKAQA
jgi:COMPASS component SPP1